MTDEFKMVQGHFCHKGYGVESCKECPRYMDDCDGDEMICSICKQELEWKELYGWTHKVKCGTEKEVMK